MLGPVRKLPVVPDSPVSPTSPTYPTHVPTLPPHPRLHQGDTVKEPIFGAYRRGPLSPAFCAFLLGETPQGIGMKGA